MYIETVRIHIPPDGAEPFEGAFASLTELLRRNRQCLAYELSRSVAAPDTYALRIEWTSDSDQIGGVRDGEHLTPLLAELMPYILGVKETFVTETTDVSGKGGALLGPA
ncbi:antibiotic biosynthesis monooxygenase family protein [Catenulispora rubra]|uniref:antibiotic biosynthesis monooxygenase family protein n=1 Tax=Catenulispora rubra TaxID=280293 RepID=UPI00189203E9|nr:antibiotic biosynthesis monooxygenase [Catenulispora rubra]